MKTLSVGFGLIASALAASRTTAPSGCLTVAKNGGDYKTVQAAVNVVNKKSGAQCIFIAEGTYDEQVKVNTKAQLTIYGSTTDTASYKANTVTITHAMSQADGVNNEGAATVGIRASGFKLYNVNVENTYGEGSQAVALSIIGDAGVYGSAITGFQDSLLSWSGNQVYVDSMVEGATDFIFGQSARSWFERVDLRVVAKSLGYVTANGRDSESNPSYYVFNNCDIAAVDGQKVPKGAYYLGRPWREYSRVAFQLTSMTNVINSQGWHEWGSEPKTGHVAWGEYKNTGDGAKGTRKYGKQLSAPLKIDEILGADYASQAYFDAEFFGGQ